MLTFDLDQLRSIKTFPALLQFLRDQLHWPVDPDQLEDLTFDYSPAEVGLDPSHAVKLRQIKQLRPLVAGQPWGIFLLEFEHRHLPIGHLRRLLRALVKNQRAAARQPLRPRWNLEDLLFVCRHTEDQQPALTFVHFRQPPAAGRAARLTSFGWTPDACGRTLLEFNLPPLRWPQNPADHDQWRAQWRSAFDVEAVTKRFFEDYKKVFAELQNRLARSTRDKQWAHDYALQLLNRLMFLYFIQRKRWLGDNPRFLADFWRAYKTSGQPKNTFFDRWLSVLFFEAFNNKFQSGRHDRRHLPPEIRSALIAAPYLNGGLFTPNKLDDAYDPKLPDDFFATLFDRFDGNSPGFLERYNFTIAESTPLDVEVAVDPEMIGKVYESLVNITFEGLTEEDLRGSAGIFYTPRVEIDLMCRLSLTDALANHLGHARKPLLYDAVFAYDPADKDAADRALAAENLWPELNRLLREITVCDPACGSGSFLVGMLLVLDDLQARANAQLGLEETPYERRRRIVGEQLYGVEVMDWAVHVAELRLWLQLVVETELKPAELRFRPLLPNLSFKIRCGDSLLQEIGGINFGLHRHHLDIPGPLKGRITQLKGKKLRFYQGEPGLREADLKTEELAIFRDILTHKRISLQKDITALTRQIEGPPEQGELAGIAPAQAKQQRLRLEDQWRAQRDEKQAELDRIEAALAALRQSKTVPFVWDIAFVEIFHGSNGAAARSAGFLPAVSPDSSRQTAQTPSASGLENRDTADWKSALPGFDIVIGNPPYVRQEMIAPPTLDPADFGGENADRWKDQKKAYKAKLQESVAAAWPKFFRYKPGRPDFRKPDGKSDLYIYFYLHGLALLNPRGSFCFITSNSWLDVGYGADLQEFLLKHSHVKFILDNEKKRSFAQADVNTIIALLAPPDDRTETGPDKTARFVMFKVPFEDVLDADTFKTLETAAERQSTDRWRICVRPQRDLLQEGLVTDEDEAGMRSVASAGPFIKTARYEANKWGGKYLRAPEIFFTILEKGKGKLVRLGDIAEVRPGCYSGINDFFYIDRTTAKQRGIENQFLKPIIRTPSDAPSPLVETSGLDTLVFCCSLTRRELEAFKGASRYIDWGARQVTRARQKTAAGIPWPNTETVKRRTPGWWAIPQDNLEPTRNFLLYVHNERFIAPFADKPVVSDRCFHRVFPADDNHAPILAALLNSTLTWLMICIHGRWGLGQGAMKFETSDARKLLVVNPSAIRPDLAHKCRERFELLGKRPVGTVEDEAFKPDRRALDEVVFEVLGLTAGEREAVYEAVINLVRARLEKAKSV